MECDSLPLERLNPNGRDKQIAFDKARHTYTITRDGASEVAPTSVTSFCKSCFKQFDPDRVVNQNYAKWASNTNSKYYPLIHSALLMGGGEEEAKAAIKAQWIQNGEDASAKGTSMHADAEIMMNGMVAPDTPEMRLLAKWRREFQPSMSWIPERTEMMLWWEDERCANRVLVAGTLDLLMKSETTGQYGLFDFKRTNPTPKYPGGPYNLLEPATNARYHPGYASSPLSEVENSDFGKYTMQLNILAKMLRERYGYDVGKHMYLVQMHEDMEEAHTVQVPHVRDATNSLFNIEAERLAEKYKSDSP